MGNDKKNKQNKDAVKPATPAKQEKPEVTADDVELLQLEAAELLGAVPPPVPLAEDTTLRELFDRTNGVFSKLKEAEARAKDAEKRSTEQMTLAREKTKEAEKQMDEASARQKKADRFVTEYQGYLDKLAEFTRPEGFTPEPIADANIPPAADSHKRAYDALRTFNAAKKKAEEATVAANAKEKEFHQRKGELDSLEKNLKQQKGDLDKRETGIFEREAKVAERENNAENDFLAQRRLILEPLEAQLAQLRSDRDSLIKQLDELRTSDIAEWQKRCAEREEKWRKEDLDRAIKSDDQKNALTKALEAEREKKLAELRDELEDIRLAEYEKRDALWTARDEELQAREMALVEKEKQLRKLRNELQAENELLNEDRGDFDKKVERRGAEKVAALEEELAATKEHLETTIKVRDQYYRDRAAREELERQLGGRSPKDVLDSLDALKRQCADLQNKLDASFGEETAQRLASRERELSSVCEQRDTLQTKLVDVEQRLITQRTAAVGTDNLRRENEALETRNKMLVQTMDAQEKLLGAKINELRAEVEQYTQADDERNPFKALVTLDEDEACKKGPLPTAPLDATLPTLKDFVADLQHRIAVAQKDKRLYYSKRDIRCFLGGMAMSKLMLLQGISGTGKTSLPLALAHAIGAEAVTVEVQAGWRDRQDLLGYYNAFHRQYYTTNFLQALYKAGTPGFRDRLFLIVLDEINLSRVEQFFADFLSALELPEERRIITLLPEKVTDAPPALLEDGRHLRIPPNVWFVGTANHDETTTEFAPKTYDRAHIMELPRSPSQFAVEVKPQRNPISCAGLTQLMQTAQGQERRKKEVAEVLEWLRKGELVTILEKRFRLGWGNRLERDVERFVPIVAEAGGNVGEAVDHLLQTKVFRKLQNRHDVRHTALDEVRNILKSNWPANFGGEASRTLELLDHEIQSKKHQDE